MHEEPLEGGRVTPGVVRVGDTVRRPPRENSDFVRRLLTELRFDGAPEWLGTDDEGREVFSYLEGEVPPELDASYGDETLAAAAGLIRRYHDATAGSPLAGGAEVVCHGDLSPCNVVFRDGRPAAIIDFDSAAPGARLDDVGYAIFLWLNLGTDGPPPAEQRRRIELFCRAYGIEPGDDVLDAATNAVATTIDRLRGEQPQAAEWWSAQLEWLERNRDALR
jgi:hypothetical protein